MWQADHLFPSVSTSCELRMYPMQVYVLNLCRQNGGNWRCLCMLEKAFVAGFVETAKIARPPSPSVRHAVRQSVFRTFFLDICVTRTVRSVRLFLRGQHSQLRTSGSRQELCVSLLVCPARETSSDAVSSTCCFCLTRSTTPNTSFVRCGIRLVVYC